MTKSFPIVRASLVSVASLLSLVVLPSGTERSSTTAGIRGLYAQEDCRDAPLNVIFQSEAITGATFQTVERFAGAREEFEIDNASPTTVYAAVVSNSDGPGVHGWSLGIAVDGNVTILGATTSGTAGDLELHGGLRRRPGGFEVTQVVDPKLNSGQRGVVSSVVLSSRRDLVELLPIGTSTALAVELRPANPFVERVAGRLSCRNNLTGTGKPVQIGAVIDGRLRDFCECREAALTSFVSASHAPFRRGDANDDGSLDIADVIWILSRLFRGGPRSPCADAADVDDSGTVELSDAAALLNFQFLGGAPPAAPFPLCGFDRTDDTGDDIAENDLPCPSGKPTNCRADG